MDSKRIRRKENLEDNTYPSSVEKLSVKEFGEKISRELSTKSNETSCAILYIIFDFTLF